MFLVYFDNYIVMNFGFFLCLGALSLISVQFKFGFVEYNIVIDCSVRFGFYIYPGLNRFVFAYVLFSFAVLVLIHRLTL